MSESKVTWKYPLQVRHGTLVDDDIRPIALFGKNKDDQQYIADALNALAGVDDPAAIMKQCRDVVTALLRIVTSRSSCDCITNDVSPDFDHVCSQCRARDLLALLPKDGGA